MVKYITCSAWPYINNVPHLGTMIGSLLSGDVYTRFLKLMGEEVIYVSGSDEHGSPIEVEARKRGIDPKEMTDAMHEYVKKIIEEWEIDFTNYTRTHNPVHIKFVQDFMMKLYENGYIIKKKEVLPYCPKCKIFLADRFIVGTCPYCGYDKARGDQCENCGRLLHPTELINPRCVFCGSTPIYKETDHWFFQLKKLTDRLIEWLEKHPSLEDNVRKFSLNWVKEGLRERSITRDSSWGVPAPFPGAEQKTIYVWFDALLGYISAVKEYFLKEGRPEEFGDWWKNSDTRTIYFIGKDNIPFHSIIFPAMIMASGEPYPLPWRISATEYLLFQEEKFSKSRGVGVWSDEALEILPADYWRFALIRMRPEGKDTSFSWTEFYRIINTELNDDIGNLIHRILSFTWSRYDGRVPDKADIDDNFMKNVKEKCEKIIRLFESIRLRQAAGEIVELARMGNQYLNIQEPWKLYKENPEKAKKVIYTGINLVRIIALLMYPITPQSSEKVYKILGLESPRRGEYKEPWSLRIKPGTRIRRPEPIFRKLPRDFVDKINEILEEARKKVASKRPKLKERNG